MLKHRFLNNEVDHLLIKIAKRTYFILSSAKNRNLTSLVEFLEFTPPDQTGYFKNFYGRDESSGTCVVHRVPVTTGTSTPAKQNGLRSQAVF